MRNEAAEHGRRLPWADVLLSAIASVSWALIGMAGTAALGLHLLRADAAGSLGPMTAAVVALGANGSVRPSGNVSAFGLKGAEATTAVEITPLGVGLVGALLLSWFFLRSLRAAGVVVAPSELLARAGAVVALFVAMLGGLAWAGHDVVTIDGGSLGLDRLPGGRGGGSVGIPGLGDLGGLLPSRIGDLVRAKASVGFSVDTMPTLLGGAAWAAGVLVIALLASRRTPLPRGWEAVHRVVRPAVSALAAVMLTAVVAGLAAAAYAATGDDHPARIAGAALLGAPNGVWLAVPLGLFVPWDGKATGELAKLLPDPLDRLLSVRTGQSVTLERLAGLDGKVWLLAVAAALMMLFAGVLTAARTPLVGGGDAAAVPGVTASAVRATGPLGFAGRCALRLGIVTAAALPLLVLLTDVSVDASLSVFGFDAFGAGVELHGDLGAAVLLGAAWGAGAGAAGALLAYATGAAGSRAAPLARGDAVWRATSASPVATARREAGPYTPGTPYRPPNPDTNPYLRLPEALRKAEDARPGAGAGQGEDARAGEGARAWAAGEPPEGSARPAGGDVSGAPTVIRPIEPPVPPSRRRTSGTSSSPDQGPPPPPPPPPPGPSRGRG
ncbi:streptophobe family protein [Streptomyces glomeratus]|uniref:Streptophobe family protein n=1 Tax=Streptomyces glomeratus TaxID=284452 RepID=A0ABP6LEC3_9ACTN|nr:streptophobe family protein [Streptomyces glomeratus]MCF1509929.1 streptophobe family protein [Streptomyces glomeratus]